MGELRLVIGGFATRGLAGLTQAQLKFQFWGQEGAPVTLAVPLVDLTRIPSALNAVASELSNASSADISINSRAAEGITCDVTFPVYTDERNFATYLRDMVRSGSFHR